MSWVWLGQATKLILRQSMKYLANLKARHRGHCTQHANFIKCKFNLVSGFSGELEILIFRNHIAK